jgi:type I restriction enzyme S subunit
MADLINGEVPVGWEFTTLGAICERGGGSIQTGPFGSQLHASDYVPVGIPSVMPVNIGDNRIVEDGIMRITEADATRLSRHRLQVGDIVYSRRGDVERRALVREPQEGWLCGTGCLKVRLGDGLVDPLFASLYLGHPAVRQWIVQHAVGATMPNLNTEIMSAIPFALPPLPEQKRIAHILGTLDDKIELNRRMNATLEGISRAIFKSWFVDFDPVRQKAAGKQPVGMDAQTAALFPDSFEDSEIGEVPKGWAVAPLDEIADFLNGLALQKYPAGDGPTLPVIKIAQLRKGNATDADRCNDAVPFEYVIEDGDVLFSWSGSLEVVIWCGGRGALNQHLFKVTSQSHPKWFYHLWTLHHLADFRLIAADKATTMGHIQRKHLSAAKVIVPPAGCIDGMTRTMEPLLLQSVRTRKESRTLAALRDTLLPKLLSGEIRVPEAEQAVEESPI